MNTAFGSFLGSGTSITEHHLPLVCCVMIFTPDRLSMSRAARECCYRQTYPDNQAILLMFGDQEATIGETRNASCRYAIAKDPVTVFAHWDSDDWSHPRRLTEQVALIESTGVDVVGYYDMPIYDQICDEVWMYANRVAHQVLGTSLMYRRSAWERKSFPATSIGEDVAFCYRHRDSIRAVTSIGPDGEPRMIARVHGSNTTLHNGLNAAREGRTRQFGKLADDDPLAVYVRKVMR